MSCGQSNMKGSISRSRPADLARKVEHIAKTREMVLVTTFYHTTLMGALRIEVKTTVSGSDTPFYLLDQSFIAAKFM